MESVIPYRVGVLILLLAAVPAYGQNPSPAPGLDLPPSMDEELKRPALAPGEGELRGYWVARCRRGEPACDDALSRAAGQMWLKIRKCWQPPARPSLKTVLSTALRFGGSGRSAPPPAREKTVVSIVFQLDPGGKLVARPTVNKEEPTAATPDMIAGVVAAVERCQPYEMLSGIPYEQWKDVFIRVGIEFTANPRVGNSGL